MIAFIQGELCEVGQDTIIVACQGIGYEIQVPVSVAQSLPDPGSRVKIYTYTYVREDALGLFEDAKAISKAPGIGPKTAKRMIIELKDKLDLESMIDNHGDSSTYAAGNAEAAASVRDEVIMALTALGYSNTEAVRAVRAVSGADEMDSETLLKQALKKIMVF